MESINNKSKDSKIGYSIRHPKAVLQRHKNRFLSEIEEKMILREESIDRWKKKQFLKG